ncbi:MAG: phasin family protein [Aeromicrobium sp.]|nr:phasin family protein [Burkholderiales bacterium]
MAPKTTKRTTRTKTATKPATKPAAKKIAAARVPMTARSVALAGIGAGASALKRAQDEAMNVYATISKQAEALRTMTSEAADTLASKTGMFAREGKKIQNKAAMTAQAQASGAAKEVKAFAKKSQKALKQNVAKSIDAAVANAKEGVTRLEHVFETRVARTLNTFGVPSAQNVRELQARMADLQKALNQLNRRGVRA